jgi:protein-S-isoprenylcysteine O-methyltransferase Ste14
MWMLLLLGGIVLFDGLLLLSFWRQFRRHGDWGIAFFRRKNYSQNIQDAGTVLLMVLLPCQAISVAVRSPSKYQLPTEDPLIELSRVLGAVLLFGGVLLCFVSQRNMGSTWRIGVVERAKLGLTTTGLYVYSRNPIFLGLLAAIAGYALLLPTELSLVLFIAACIGVRRQIAVEEKHLLSTYGDVYRAYAQSVGRFIPLIGKMRPVRSDARGRHGAGESISGLPDELARGRPPR